MVVRSVAIAQVFGLLLLGCGGGEDDSSSTLDSGITGETGSGETGVETDTEDECISFAATLEECGEVVLPVDGWEFGGYYDGVNPESGSLINTLSALIDDHSHVSYDNLWERFDKTDMREDGTLWDIYSDNPDGETAYIYEVGPDKCGEYSAEGYCYNREHLWPSSWFGGGSPMKSDLHHVYPTDGYVNSRRSSHPFGEVERATWTSTNGSKLGRGEQCDAPLQLFEPHDAYKGDIARAMLYMATRYRFEDEGWDSSNATEQASIDPWEEELLRYWHQLDPVSEKELARNDAIFAIQGNRNPFVDHPEWVCLIEDF